MQSLVQVSFRYNSAKSVQEKNTTFPFLKNNFICLFIFGCAGCWLLPRLFSGSGARATHCRGFSESVGSRAHRLQELQNMGSVVVTPGSVVACGLSCSMSC